MTFRARARAASARLHEEALREAGAAAEVLKLAHTMATPTTAVTRAAGRLISASAKSAAAGVLRVVGGREPAATAQHHRDAAAAWAAVGEAAARVPTSFVGGPPVTYEIERRYRSAGRCPRCYFGGCDVFETAIDGIIAFKLRCAECGLDQRIEDA